MTRRKARLPAWVIFCAGLLALAACGQSDPAELIASAQRSLDRDQVSAALIDSRNALKQQPESASARLMLARVLAAQGDLAGAAIELDRAVKFGASEDDTLPVGVSMLLSQHRFRAVVAAYADKRLQTADADARLRLQVATAYRALGNNQEAEAALQDALNQVPGHAQASALQASLAMERGDVAKASQVAADLLARDPTMAEALLLQGDLLAHGGADLPGAVRAYRKALESRPRSLEAHGRIITLLVNSGDLSEADKQVAALAKALPGRPLTVFYQALMAYLRNDMRKVRELSQPLLRAWPLAQVYFMAGMAEMRLGAMVQAETLLSKAVKGMPTVPEPIVELAGLYLELARPAAALETLKPLLAAQPQNADALRVAGQAHSLAGDFRSADAAFAQAARVRPVDTRLRTSMAFSLIQRGDPAAGIRELHSAAASDAQGSAADLALVAAEMRRNNVAGALQAVDALDRKRPGQALPDLLRGRIHRQAGDLPAARRAYEAVLARAPEHAGAIAELVSLDLAEHKTASVRKRFEALLKQNPRSVAALMGLADLERREGKPAGVAFEWVDRAVKAHPTDVQTWQSALAFHREMGDLPALLARARDAVAAVPNDPGLLLQVAEAQLAGGDGQQALSSLNRVVELDAENYAGHLRLAQLHLSNRRLPAARLHVERIRKLQPDALATQRTAIALARLDGGSKAVADIVSGLQGRLPDAPLGWILEGEAAVAAQQWPLAVAAFRKALSKQESTAVAMQLHRALTGAKRLPEAEAFADEWLRAHDADFAFVNYLGEDALKRRDWTVAEARFGQAAKMRPQAGAVLNNLAYALVQRKRPEALAHAQRAVELTPWSPGFMDTLALAYAAAGKMDKAIEWQEKATTLAPQVGAYRLQLAGFYLSAGEKNKARRALELLERQGLNGASAEEVQRMLQRAKG